MKLFNLCKRLLRFKDGLIRLVLEVLYLVIEHGSLGLVLFPFLSEFVDVFVFLVDFIKLVVPLAQGHDLFDSLCLQRVIVHLHFCDGFVFFEGIFYQLSSFGLDKVVSETEGLYGSEGTLYHLDELFRDVLALNLAFRKVKFFNAESLLVFNE